MERFTQEYSQVYKRQDLKLAGIEVYDAGVIILYAISTYQNIGIWLTQANETPKKFMNNDICTLFFFLVIK